MARKRQKNVEKRNVSTYEAGLVLEDKMMLPVRLSAAFVLGGWSKIANNKDEFRELLKKGLELSPVSEVLIKWEKPISAPQN